MSNGDDSVDWGGDEVFAQDDSFRSVTLTMRQGPNPGQRFTVRKDHITIGRLPTNDISIPDPQVSRHHANITWERDQFVLRDLGSANGTSVNGLPLSGPYPLRDGDVIAFGDVVLTFQGMTGLPDTPVRTYAPAKGPRAGLPPRQPGTIAMGTSAARPSGASLWPILLGIGLALILVLLVVAGILIFAFSQSTQSIPEIRVQQPVSGSRAMVGEPVMILASASDPRGVSRVEFRVNGELNATVQSNDPNGQPVLLVQQNWTPSHTGTNNLVLTAYNTTGRASEPVAIAIDVTAKEERSDGTGASAPTATPTLVVQPTETPTPTPIATTPACTHDAAFVADVTVPDNSIFRPGERFDKTWRIRNSGSCPWETGYRLIFVSGEKLGAPDYQSVVPTAPGGTTDVTVTMYAPNRYGAFTGVWRMVNAQGEPFGHRFTVVIQVPAPYTPTPTITPTFTPRPGPLVSISVDRDYINAGECTIVRASVEGVSAAWLDGEPIVGGYKEKQVCPCNETRYTVEAALTSGERVIRDVTVRVEGECIIDKPDLVVRDLVPDPSDKKPFVGEQFTMRMRIKNQGHREARDIFCSWRPKGSGSPRIVVGEGINLDPDEDRWLQWDYTYTEAGEYETIAEVDFNNNIDEIDEGNNTRTRKIQVLALP